MASYGQLEHARDNLRAALDWCHAQPGVAERDVHQVTALARTSVREPITSLQRQTNGLIQRERAAGRQGGGEPGLA